MSLALFSIRTVPIYLKVTVNIYKPQITAVLYVFKVRPKNLYSFMSFSSISCIQESTESIQDQASIIPSLFWYLEWSVFKSYLENSNSGVKVSSSSGMFSNSLSYSFFDKIAAIMGDNAMSLISNDELLTAVEYVGVEDVADLKEKGLFRFIKDHSSLTL